MLALTLFSVLFNSQQLVFSACVAAVKCRPVLHRCVVILFWSSGIMDCMLFTFENTCIVPFMRWGRGIFHIHWWTASIKPRLLFWVGMLYFGTIISFQLPQHKYKVTRTVQTRLVVVLHLHHVNWPLQVHLCDKNLNRALYWKKKLQTTMAFIRS